MSLRLSKYLIDLRKNANRMSRTNINGITDNSFWGKNKQRIACALISAFFVWKLRNGFSQNFVSYSSTVLSILTGLFITAIIFSFDKFYQKPDNPNLNSRQHLWDVQAYNYSKQFAYITGYNIVLCVFALIALSFTAFFAASMNVDLFD